MTVPAIGETYRGVEGHSGYLLRQPWHAFRGAMEAALREHRLSSPQHGRILQATLTIEGERWLGAAHPAVRRLERAIERGFTGDDTVTVKAWLVAAAERLERSAAA